MPLTLYGLKNCDTCKKALKSLEGAGKDVTFIDIRAEADLEIAIPAWLAAAGPDLLINKRSTTWRNLSEAKRETEPAALLMANPTLIKRPVIEVGGDIHVGWTKDIQGKLL